MTDLTPPASRLKRDFGGQALPLYTEWGGEK